MAEEKDAGKDTSQPVDGRTARWTDVVPFRVVEGLDDATDAVPPADAPFAGPPDEERDAHGKWTAGGGGADPAANRPSRPEERHDVEPPRKKFVAPPPPKGTGRGKAGGFTATGETNTSVGDRVEALSEKLGLRNILPEGRRHGKSVAEEGSTLDREWDHSGWAFEVKACTTAAREYKAKPKAVEMEGKRRYAEMHGLKPATMIAVVDADAGKVWYYWRPGIGAFSLNPATAEKQGWAYMGTVKL